MLLNDQTAIDICHQGIDIILALQKRDGQLAGSYDNEWNSDLTFKCVTGHAQIAILANRLSNLLNTPSYQSTAQSILSEIQNTPCRLPFKKLKGAIPGSTPFHKNYMAFKYPNWAAKFFLEAIYPFLNRH